MMTLPNIDFTSAIIYLALLSQIFTISYLFAKKWVQRKTFLLNKYSPTEYPNLYVQSLSTELRRVKRRQLLDRSITVLALALVLFYFFNEININIVASSILVLAAVQLLPWSLSQRWNKQNTALMAKNFPSTIRKSSFENRNITDFVSVKKLCFAVLTYMVPLLLTLYLFITPQWHEHLINALLLILINTLIVCYLAWLLFNSLYGKKKDNFINNDDRLNLIAQRCNTLSSYLILYSIFITSSFLIKIFGLNPLFISVITSLFLQLLFAMNFSNNLTRYSDERSEKNSSKNYEVYK